MQVNAICLFGFLCTTQHPQYKCDIFLFILAFILNCIAKIMTVQMQKLDKLGIILYISLYPKHHFVATSYKNSWFFTFM